MKTIIWIGGAALATVAALVANAAVGDVVWLHTGPQFSLTAPQKTALNNWLQATFPTIDTAQLATVACGREGEGATGDVACRGVDTQTLSDSDYADLDIAGNAPGAIDSAGGGNVTISRTLGPSPVTGANLTSLANLVSAGCGVSDVATLRGFACTRSGAVVTCSCEWIKTGTPGEFVAARQAKTVAQVLGRVQ